MSAYADIVLMSTYTDFPSVYADIIPCLLIHTSHVRICGHDSTSTNLTDVGVIAHAHMNRTRGGVLY